MVDRKFYSLFFLDSDTERYIWASWLTFVLLSSAIGDSAILLSSLKYNAFKLHESIVVIIQHMAVGDLLITTTCVFPATVTLISQQWIFGTTFCYIKVYLGNVGWISTSCFICAMGFCKLVLLMSPKYSRNLTRRNAQMLCFGIWIISLPAAALAFLYFLYKLDFDFATCDELHYTFYSKNDIPEHSWRNYVQYLIMLIPVKTTFILLITILLFRQLLKARKLARRARKRARWQGIITVMLTALFHLVSYMPIIVREVAESHIREQYGLSEYVYLARISYTILYLNVVGNVFIYTLTVPSFRSFLKTTLQKFGGNLLKFNSPGPNSQETRVENHLSNTPTCLSSTRSTLA